MSSSATARPRPGTRQCPPRGARLDRRAILVRAPVSFAKTGCAGFRWGWPPRHARIASPSASIRCPRRSPSAVRGCSRSPARPKIATHLIAGEGATTSRLAATLRDMPLATAAMTHCRRLIDRGLAPGPCFPRDEGNQMRPIPRLELGLPEVQVRPDRVRLSDNGVTAVELAMSVGAFNSGLRVSEITVDSKRMDLTLRGRDDTVEHTQGIEALPAVNGGGRVSAGEFSCGCRSADGSHPNPPHRTEPRRHPSDSAEICNTSRNRN